MGISYEAAYQGPLKDSVERGWVSQDLVDRAVRRILRQKFRLGLFERPFVDPERAERIVHAREHQEVAYQAAREGIVLLKNENQLLPLSKEVRSIAVIGPNADHDKNLLGDYTSIKVTQDIVTILEGVRSKVGPGTTVRYVQGCDVVGEDRNEIEQARQAAAQSEVAIVVVGENEWRHAGQERHRGGRLRRSDPGTNRIAAGTGSSGPQHRYPHSSSPRQRTAPGNALDRRTCARDRRGMVPRRKRRCSGGRCPVR